MPGKSNNLVSSQMWHLVCVLQGEPGKPAVDGRSGYHVHVVVS